ncbi:asparagine synthase [Vibrio vulnificus]|nr:asparagine synthase-related protein [Vibrio vulnificus]EHU5196720.1 asparagine synthase [Vibrio vulnificus]ELI0348330.1 asparagine synthase [Vibrio vulnificus]MVT22033.1 asparagine synthase [Vibrio vulnificus]QBH28379.1 Asparagine synthetase (glutamine-hydrolyzing) [Vibrio vulnificus]HAS6281459.1 asparagine synthase [Vibrio vulnificus]
MCGFFISNSSEVSIEHEQIIEKKLRFRGPDCSSGLIENNGWKAYHSRLSIIDPSAGTNQPMIDEFGGMLVFNGEILNFKELGYKYFDEEFCSDTALLSNLLKYGKLDLSELDGFFAFVYVNESGELSHASRDSFGVKPLFYYKNDNGISFCSEPNVLKHLFNCEVNESAIDEYYATRAPIFSGSYFSDIQTVNPGACLIKGQYFDCATYLNGNYKSTTVEKIKEAIEVGLDTRLVSDVPVGLLLSRGIDSNLLRNMGRFDRYYSIGFSGDEDIEYLNSQNIKGLKTITCTPEEYKRAFDYLLELRGEPMSVPNEVLLYIISKSAAEDGVKVLLSGEGADEFFGGYDRIFSWAYTTNEFDLDEFLEKYCYIPPERNSELYKKFQELFGSINFGSVFEVVRWFFIKYHMPILFRRLDFSLMAAGVEGREPIANMHTFLQAIKISPNNLMGSELGKIPLREIISSYMGREFAYEKKVGFPVDLKKIFENTDNLSSYELWFKENLKVLK